MKKITAVSIIVFLYVMTFAFGITWGYLKSGSWNIHDWGYNTSKWVSAWWVCMGGLTTLLAVIFVCMHYFKRIMDDHKKMLEAQRISNENYQ